MKQRTNDHRLLRWILTILMVLVTLACLAGIGFWAYDAGTSSPVPDFSSVTSSSEEGGNAENGDGESSETEPAVVSEVTVGEEENDSEESTAADGSVEPMVEELPGAAEEE